MAIYEIVDGKNRRVARLHQLLARKEATRYLRRVLS